MLFLANAHIVLFAGDEEGSGETDAIGGWVEGIAIATPALGGEKGVGVHYESWPQFRGLEVRTAKIIVIFRRGLAPDFDACKVQLFLIREIILAILAQHAQEINLCKQTCFQQHQSM